MAVIRLPEIEEIFTVLDRLGISREAVVIPLTKRDPGSVRLFRTKSSRSSCPSRRRWPRGSPSSSVDIGRGDGSGERLSNARRAATS